MLLRFAFENYRSFRDYAAVSFVSTKLKDAPAWRMPADGVPAGVLPVLGVYGANASGKSAILQALDDLVHHVRHSFTGLKPDQPIPWVPWRLDRSEGAPLTRLEVDFTVEGVRHHYGFRFSASRFEEEWLYRWPKGTRQVLFHRDHSQEEPWYFGRELRGARRVVADATRPNALFLSAAAQLNHDELGRVAAALTQGYQREARIQLHGHPVFSKSSPLLGDAQRATVRRLLVAADLGVRDLRPKAAPELKVDAFVKEFGEAEPPMELWLRHGQTDEDSWELPPDLESRGTSVLLVRLNDILMVLQSGGVMVVDEIDTSLHPDLCVEIVALFTNEATNPRGAQLLFTTHERSLLATMRRDEVLLVDKALDGASRVQTASDYSGVRARDDLARAHEQGRLGGVPVLGDFAAGVAGVLTHGA